MPEKICSGAVDAGLNDRWLMHCAQGSEMIGQQGRRGDVLIPIKEGRLVKNPDGLVFISPLQFKSQQPK
jgi:hypothetical protein